MPHTEEVLEQGFEGWVEVARQAAWWSPGSTASSGRPTG